MAKKAAKAKSRPKKKLSRYDRLERKHGLAGPKKKAMHPMDREQVCLTLSGINGSLFLPERYLYDSVFERLVDEELQSARAHHGDQRNLHESHSVILEEFEEFWDEIKERKPDMAAVLKELVQVAAMCRRCAEDVLGVGFE